MAAIIRITPPLRLHDLAETLHLLDIGHPQAEVCVDAGAIVVTEAQRATSAPAPSSIDDDENHRTEDGVRYRAEEGALCTGCMGWMENGICTLEGRTHCSAVFRRDHRSIIWVRE
jgi:hypothetical protein